MILKGTDGSLSGVTSVHVCGGGGGGYKLEGDKLVSESLH